MGKSTFLGVAVALTRILLGLMLEGGKIAQIIQPTAVIIVFGGTFGTVMIQLPPRVIIAAGPRLLPVCPGSNQSGVFSYGYVDSSSSRAQTGFTPFQKFVLSERLCAFLSLKPTRLSRNSFRPGCSKSTLPYNSPLPEIKSPGLASSACSI